MGARGAAAGAARGRVALCRASESWTSASQFRSLSTEQIDAKVVELKGELLDLRIQRAARKEVATHQFKHKRRAMAQLLTVRREKEIEQGIGTRESRKLEKKKAQDALMVRAKANSAAQLGKYDASGESAEAAQGMYEKGYTY